MTVTGPWRRLAQQLLLRAEDRLQRYLQRFLNNIILGHGTDSSLQEEDYPNLIYQVSLPPESYLVSSYCVPMRASQLRAASKHVTCLWNTCLAS